MSISHGQDECRECGMSLPNEDPRPEGAIRTPCPYCGSTKRVKSGECNMTATASVSVDARLIIGWQEVDRLLTKSEFAAALLVAAVNVEFILWEKLRQFAPDSPPPKTHNSERRTWEKIQGNRRNDVGLGSLISVACFFADRDKFALSPSLTSFGWTLNEARRNIAHVRGFFARLTRLEEADWPETRIRQILDNAKEFCHGNAP